MAKRQIRWAVLAPAAFVSTVGMAAVRPPAACPNDRAIEWVREHHDALPATLRDLRRLDPAVQRAVFSHLTSAQRTSVWRSRLSEVLTTASLSDSQKALVNEASSRMAAWQSHVDAISADSSFTSFRSRMAREFTRDSARLIFATLDPVEAETGVSTTAAWSDIVKKVVGAMPENCECNYYESDYCIGANNECALATSCDVVYLGCGTFYFYTCNGRCKAFSIS